MTSQVPAAGPIAGATVALNGTQLSTTTGAAGTYQLAQVPPGTYTVAVSAPGFSSVNVAVAVGPGEAARLGASLTPVGAGVGTGKNARRPRGRTF